MLSHHTFPTESLQSFSRILSQFFAKRKILRKLDDVLHQLIIVFRQKSISSMTNQIAYTTAFHPNHRKAGTKSLQDCNSESLFNRWRNEKIRFLKNRLNLGTTTIS